MLINLWFNNSSWYTQGKFDKNCEAAKVIENNLRDVNIALINELAVLFEKLGLDTEAILKAAGSKRNFLPFVQVSSADIVLV